MVPQDEAISNSVNVNWLITFDIVFKFDQVCQFQLEVDYFASFQH